MDIVDNYIKQPDATLKDMRLERVVERDHACQSVESGPTFLRPDTNRHVDLLRYRC